MKQKNKKRAFLSMLLGTLVASLLRSLLTGKSIIRAGKGVMRKMKAQLEPVKIFNAALSFSKF